jgi:hypothetical protein
VDQWDAETSLWDFTGIVPASRGAHCRPLHPRLASLCCRPEAETSLSDSAGIVPTNRGAHSRPVQAELAAPCRRPEDRKPMC